MPSPRLVETEDNNFDGIEPVKSEESSSEEDEKADGDYLGVDLQDVVAASNESAVSVQAPIEAQNYDEQEQQVPDTEEEEIDKELDDLDAQFADY